MHPGECCAQWREAGGVKAGKLVGKVHSGEKLVNWWEEAAAGKYFSSSNARENA